MGGERRGTYHGGGRGQERGVTLVVIVIGVPAPRRTAGQIGQVSLIIIYETICTGVAYQTVGRGGRVAALGRNCRTRLAGRGARPIEMGVCLTEDAVIIIIVHRVQRGTRTTAPQYVRRLDLVVAAVREAQLVAVAGREIEQGALERDVLGISATAAAAIEDGRRGCWRRFIGHLARRPLNACCRDGQRVAAARTDSGRRSWR